jgi:hypothetical protein
MNLFAKRIALDKIIVMLNDIIYYLGEVVYNDLELVSTNDTHEIETMTVLISIINILDKIIELHQKIEQDIIRDRRPSAER